MRKTGFIELSNIYIQEKDYTGNGYEQATLCGYPITEAYKKKGSGKKLPDRNIKPERRREKSESDRSKLFLKGIRPSNIW